MKAIDELIGYLFWTLVIAIAIVFVGVWCGKTFGMVIYQAPPTPVVVACRQDVACPVIEKTYVSVMYKEHPTNVAPNTGTTGIAPTVYRSLYEVSPISYSGIGGGWDVRGAVYQPHYQQPMMHYRQQQPMYQPSFAPMGYGGFGMGGGFSRCGPGGCR